jgi:hypothetical protein
LIENIRKHTSQLVCACSEDTAGDAVSPQESLECDGTRTKPSSNLDDDRPVVRRFMGLLVEPGSVVTPVALVTNNVYRFLLYSSHIYVLYSFLLYFNLCHSDIAHPNTYIFLNSIILLLGCVYYVCCELLDITAQLELGTQAFCYTHNNIC